MKPWWKIHLFISVHSMIQGQYKVLKRMTISWLQLQSVCLCTSRLNPNSSKQIYASPKNNAGQMICWFIEIGHLCTTTNYILVINMMNRWIRWLLWPAVKNLQLFHSLSENGAAKKLQQMLVTIMAFKWYFDGAGHHIHEYPQIYLDYMSR